MPNRKVFLYIYSDTITEDGHYTSPRFSDGAYCSISDTPVSNSDNKHGYLTPTFGNRETFDKYGYLLPKGGQTPEYIEVQDALFEKKKE